MNMNYLAVCHFTDAAKLYRFVLHPHAQCTLYPVLLKTRYMASSRNMTLASHSVCHTFSVRCVSEKTGKGLYEWSLPI